jgi:hypothetical protein
MAKPVPTAPEPTIEAPKFTLVDAVMLLLALFSVGLVLLDVFGRRFLYQWGIFPEVVLLDFIITLVFLGEFLWKVDKRHSLARVVRNNWFDLVGMVPLAAFVALEANLQDVPVFAALTGTVQLTGRAGAGGLIRLFRFIRVVRIVQAFSRFLRATNMTFGEQVTKRVFDKYRRIIVMELTTPIMVAGITVSQEIIIRMKFLESAGKAIDAKRAEIHAAVIEALHRNKVPDSVITQPLVERIVNQVEETVINTVVDTLTGPELNKLTQEMIVEVLENFKQQLTSPEGKELLRTMGTPEAERTPTPQVAPSPP